MEELLSIKDHRAPAMTMQCSSTFCTGNERQERRKKGPKDRGERLRRTQRETDGQ